jgi:2-C-methyl-D-erythritol 4-phosphate cytidylyltransferase/2-C-methyl-D-erythritol 2,4-cyclodiphosphate synthase
MTELPPRESVGAVVTAGGVGTRFGSLKQFASLDGRPVLARAVEVASRFAGAIAIPLPQGHEASARSALEGLPERDDLKVVFAEGGATRALSVLAGLKALPEVEWVLVHDAARPFASPELFARVLTAAQRVGAAIPALACSDTIKRTAGALVVETLDRSALCLVQTPQAFRRAALLEAYERLGEAASQRTDDAAVYEVLGKPVARVEGDAQNRKLTRPEDLTAPGATVGRMRIGFGYDTHAFGPDRRLVLGGVEFPGDGLLGESDADIVAHAVTDAVLGAAALGDLGRHFPRGDERFRGANSLELLAVAVRLALEAGYRINNVDLTVAGSRPKIAPQARKMAENLARVLEITPGDVNVKATTGDGLGFFGRGEGIAVHAVVLLQGQSR